MPKIPKQMFYDGIFPECDKLIEIARDAGAQASSAIKAAPSKRLELAVQEMEIRAFELEKLKEAHRKSKCFFIDSLTQDSLLNVPHSKQNYTETMNLPFPLMFFEFEEPIKLDLSELVGEKLDVRGITLSRCSELIRIGLKPKIAGATLDEVNLDEQYEMFLHFTDSNREYAYDLINFNLRTLPFFTFMSQTDFLAIDPQNNNVSDLRNITKFDARPYSNKVFESCLPEETAELNDEHTELSQMIDLCINLINCINARNVEIRKVERGPLIDAQKLRRLNKKRAKKDKNPLPFVPLKPYYVIEVKKHVYIDEEKNEEDKAWELSYRVWVRGHNRHYRDQTGNVRYIEWIEPHVRGPPNALWKHNRYAVLYQRLGHLLHNSKYRKKD